MKAALHLHLLVEELQGLYSAETQLLKALPKMVEAATSKQIRVALEQQHQEIKLRVTGIERMFADWNANFQTPPKAVQQSLWRTANLRSPVYWV